MDILNQLAPRIEDRTKVLIRARLRQDGPDGDACILDISSRGMLLTMADPPGHGHSVEVVAHGHALLGHVEWTKGRRFGICLRDRINHAAFIAGMDGPIVIRQNIVRTAVRGDSSNAAISSERFSTIVRFSVGLLAAIVAAYLMADVVGQTLRSVFSSAGGGMDGPVGNSD